MSAVSCYVHGSTFPKSTCHLHHEAPRMAGGGDEASNLIWLCANCHNTAHRVAQLQETGKSGEASDIGDLLFQDASQRNRFYQVVGEILQAVTLAKGTGKRKAKTRIELDLDPLVHDRLKTLVSSIRTNGKKVSLAKYVESLVTADLRKKGYF